MRIKHNLLDFVFNRFFKVGQSKHTQAGKLDCHVLFL